MYFAWGLGLPNNILCNMIGSAFHNLPRVGEWNNSRVKVIKYNQEIRLIKSDQRIELIKLNQRMGLIKLNQYIQ